MASNKKINDTGTRVKALQNNYVDLTKTGPLTYRELADLIGDTREYTPSNKIAADNQPIPILNSIVDSNRGVQYVQSDYGNSIYDPEGFATSGQIAQLDEMRIAGLSPSAIATKLDKTISTITSYIRRHPVPQGVVLCRHCGSFIKVEPGKKQRRWSDKQRCW